MTIPECRALQSKDLPSLKRLHKFAKFEGAAVFGDDQTGVEEMLHSACNGLDGVTGHAVDSDGIAGAITLQTEGDADTSDNQPLVILTVVVRADMRASGVASALLSAAVQQADQNGQTSLLTDVATGNRPAIAFFLRNGFHVQKEAGLTTELSRQLSSPAALQAGNPRPSSSTSLACMCPSSQQQLRFPQLPARPFLTTITRPGIRTRSLMLR